MILSDVGIRAAIEAGELEVDPAPTADQYTPSSLDLHLGGSFKVWDSRLGTPGFIPTLDLAEQTFTQTARGFLMDAPVEGDGAFVLQPGGFVLAMTRERINLKRSSRLAGRIEGRSSMARLGLVVHLTAPTIHAGFEGKVTLEMVNFGRFHLRLIPERTRLCQLVVERLSEESGQDLRSGFVGQGEPGGGA